MRTLFQESIFLQPHLYGSYFRMEENRFAHQSASAPEAATDESASPFNPAHEEDRAQPLPPLLSDFNPAPLRYRHDGLTPQRQREYVEALADCGIAREAAARVGVSERAVARVRRGSAGSGDFYAQGS